MNKEARYAAAAAACKVITAKDLRSAEGKQLVADMYAAVGHGPMEGWSSREFAKHTHRTITAFNPRAYPQP